jgi:hypothetical protein
MLLLNDSRGNKQVAVITSVVVAAAASYSPNLYQNHYYNDYHEGVLEITKTFVKMLSNQLINKKMVVSVKAK